MSTLKKILEQRGLGMGKRPCCPGCGMRMRMQQGNCPDCGVSYGLGMGAADAPGMSEGAETTDAKSDVSDDSRVEKTNKLGKKTKASKIVFSTGEDDSTKRVQEDVDTSEYAIKKYVDQTGETKTRKIRPHRIDFKNSKSGGEPAQEDDSKKKVQEDMKPTYKELTSAYSALRLESLQLEDEINEVLSKDAAAGEWISDFVHSDNPKFAGKSKEKRKQMALAAYYAKQKNEEVELDEKVYQNKTTGETFGTVDKPVVKPTAPAAAPAKPQSALERVRTRMAASKTVKEGMTRQDRERAANEQERRAAAIANNPRIAAEVERRRKAAEAAKAEVKEEVDESAVPERMKGKQKPYVSSSGSDHEVLGNVGQVKATFTQKEHGKEARAKAQAHLKQHYDAYMKEEVELDETDDALNKRKVAMAAFDKKSTADYWKKHAELKKHDPRTAKPANKSVKEDLELDEAEKEYKISTAQMGHAGKTTIKHIKNPDVTQRMAAHDVKSYADRIALLKDAKRKGNLKEDDMQESVFDYKNNPRETKDKTKTSTYHNVKKISTGTVYTKQFDKDGTSKGSGDDAAKKAEGAVKRGRGRPKKDRFAESVEVLMNLSEEQFDSMMEEGFDAFFEAFEQLDELSKTTLGSYAKQASRSAAGLATTAMHHQNTSLEWSKRQHTDKDPKDAKKSSDTFHKQSVAATEKQIKRQQGVTTAVNKLTK